jgi:hypothetical protein
MPHRQRSMTGWRCACSAFGGTDARSWIVDALTVSFHGLPGGADAAARSMLRLLLPMLGNRWQIAQSGDSDVVILEADTLAALRSSGAARDDTLYVVFSRDSALPPGAFATIQRPLNSGRLVEMLNAAQDALEERMLHPANTTFAEEVADDTLEGEKERSTRTTIRSAIGRVLEDTSIAVALRDLQGVMVVTVLPELGYSTPLRSNALADLIRMNAEVDVVDLNDSERVTLGERLKLAPLEKLQWIYWLAGSDGKIRPGLTVSHRYQLRKYPNFSVLPHYRGDVRMASLLKTQALTVGELAQRAGVRLETACHFVNACWALGYLGDPALRTTAQSAPGAEAAGSPAEPMLAG